MGLNILDSVNYYTVNIDKIDEETKKKMEEEYGSLENETFLSICMCDIDKFNIDYNAVNWDSGEFMEEELEWLLESYLNEHPYYLVFASGCRWNGASGYKICTNINDTVYRDYEVTLTLEEQGKDCIKCRESSHDVPMGSTTIIIGLTNEEYEKLEDASFEEVEKFAMSKF
jgi:hypothetical protein